MIKLKEGDKAPVFTGNDQDGRKVSLADFKGKKVVLYFYMLKKKGFEVIGVSPDEVAKNKKFEQRNKLPFTLIADISHKILDKYGVWDQKQLFGHKYMGVLRTTFVIDEKGIICKIFLKPKSKSHAEEIMTAVK